MQILLCVNKFKNQIIPFLTEGVVNKYSAVVIVWCHEYPVWGGSGERRGKVGVVICKSNTSFC